MNASLRPWRSDVRVSLIVAVADNGVIGARGKLPWALPEDLKHFKALTMGKPIIMGRKTFQSLGRALPGRQNIVISRDRAFVAEGARVVPDFESALWAAACVEEIMVIGGAEIYALALPAADRIYMTEVHLTADGDTFFPAFARSEWRETSRIEHPARAGRPAFSFVVLDRIGRRSPDLLNAS